MESAKHVMIKVKLDKQLAGHSSAPYVSLKTHHSEKYVSVKFAEYKLLGNQIDTLVKVIEKLIQDLK